MHLVSATIARISQDCAERINGVVATAQDRVAAAPVKRMDETGFRIGAKTHRLYIPPTLRLTLYRVSPKRGTLLRRGCHVSNLGASET